MRSSCLQPQPQKAEAEAEAEAEAALGLSNEALVIHNRLAGIKGTFPVCFSSGA